MTRPDPTPEQLEAARAAGLPDSLAWRLAGSTPGELAADAADFAAAWARPSLHVPSDEERRRESSRNALGLALAAWRGDLGAIYHVWAGLSELERIDLLSGMAQLPGFALHACQLDPEQVLGEELDARRLS